MNTVKGHFERYSPAYLRAVMYILLAGLRPIREAIESMPASMVESMSWSAWLLLVLKSFDSMALTAIVFLDQSISRLSQPRPAAKEPDHLEA